jgi:hypothetical protein
VEGCVGWKGARGGPPGLTPSGGGNAEGRGCAMPARGPRSQYAPLRSTPVARPTGNADVLAGSLEKG